MESGTLLATSGSSYFRRYFVVKGVPMFAARVNDAHICPKSEPGPVPHVGGAITTGVNSVLIAGQIAATSGSSAVCACPPPPLPPLPPGVPPPPPVPPPPGIPNSVTKGSATVLIGGKAAARVGDSLSHGGTIATGAATVDIGG